MSKIAVTMGLSLGILLAQSPGDAASWALSGDEMMKKMQEQIENLQKRLTDVEKRNAELEKRLSEQAAPAAPPAKPAEEIKSIPAKAEKPSITAKYGVDLYGYIKFDAAYDTQRTSLGNYARWVESGAAGGDDDQFTATANQTRFGLNFTGPDYGNMKTTGKMEVDFYGGGSENKANPMMRHAYVQLDWPDYDLSVLAGQTSDVISPLVPTTVNYAVGWWVGDLGYRRPQLRVTKNFDPTDNSKLMFQGALSRTIGEGWGLPASASYLDNGSDSGFPTLQGRVAYAFPLLTDKPSIIGVSGHWGQEEYDGGTFTGIAYGARDFNTWSANLDVTLPLLDKLKLMSELWFGENLDAYLGGIAQGLRGIDVDGNNSIDAPGEGIRALGGWAALGLGPWNQWSFNVGASIDDPEEDDLNAGGRSQNYSIFGNAFYEINEAILLGLELSYWDTDYQDREDEDSVRVQTTLIYRF
ncbi:MAG: hypothetical protein AB1656_11775 [Candidatus Omnitrophota bacterium]